MEQKAYKIFIIEDSDKDRELLEKSLASYNLFQVVGCLPGGSGALALIQRLHPDLLFIDVELPGLPGYEIVNKLHDVVMWDMKVVFYTAYPQYMLEAIRSAAFDFLLKPKRTATYLKKGNPYFGRQMEYKLSIPDQFTEKLYVPIQHYMVWSASFLRRIQQGSVRLYISYVMVAMLLVLIWGAM